MDDLENTGAPPGQGGGGTDAEGADSVIESILFVSGEPVKVARLAAVLGVSEGEVEAAADRMRDKYSFERRGIRLVKLEDSLQLCSAPEHADVIRRALETRKPPSLSPPALEVLSIVAYFQPVTRAYIEQIRGVDSVYTVGMLLDRGLIEACGRMAAPGRPMLYKTTYAFLRTFKLQSLSELPELPEIEAADDGREGIRSAISELRLKEAAEAEKETPKQAEPAGVAAAEAAPLEEAHEAESGDIT